MKFQEKYVLHNVNIIDGTGKAVEKEKSIAIENGYIVSIADSKDYKPEEDMQVIDLEGCTVMPGMIDSHIHLFGAAENIDDELITSDITMQALRSVGQAQKMLKYGFTSLRDLTYNGLYLKRIFAEGEITGPRIVCSGPGLSHMAGYTAGANYETLDRVRFKNNWGMGCYGKEDMSKAISILFSEGADQIKVFANGSGGGMKDRVLDQHFDLDDLKFIVKESKKINGTKTIAHIFDNKTAWDCLEAGIDTFEHLGFLDEELCDEMVKQNKYLVPTATLLVLWAQEGMDFPVRDGYFHKDIFENGVFDGISDDFARKKCVEDFKMAHRKGVKIALGTDTITDSMTPYGEFSVLELKTMVDLGMTPLEAIRSATQIGSEVLGFEDYIGTVEEGKFADLLILNDNPSEDIEILMNPDKIDYVLQSGKVIVDHGQML